MSEVPEMVVNQMLTEFAERDILHCMPYGNAGSKKSTLAASFPKPMVVLLFDKLSKAGPYRRRGKRGVVVFEEDYGVKVEYVMSTKEPKAVIKIVHFDDFDVKDAKQTYAAELLNTYMQRIYTEVNAGLWATVVLDSLSFLEYSIRKAEQYKFNPSSKAGNQQDSRQHYRDSAEGIEEVLFALTSLNCNVVVPAHVKNEIDKQRELLLWTPEAPGRRNRTLPAAFGEVYAMHFDKETEDVLMQTTQSENYLACSQINAPNWVEPNYKALWANFKPVEKD